MAKVMISMPLYDAKMGLETLQSLQNQLTNGLHQTETQYVYGGALITQARIDHFGMFVARKEFDYLLTVDGDIAFNVDPRTIPAGQHVGVLDRLVDRNKDYIGGLYARKQMGRTGVPSVNGITINGTEPKIMDGALTQMKYLPTGLTLMSRNCAERMVEAYKDLMFESFVFPFPMYAVYNTMIAPDEKGIPRFLPEDFSFCKRWTDIGGEIWADTSLMLGHVGPYIYHIEHLRK